MAQRNFDNNNLHDRVIAEIVNVLNQEEHDVYTNPGNEKNAGIVGNYPDVVMTEKGGTTVKFILEIETSDSITLIEANEQWKKYANEIKATFYIVVPESSLQKAKELCQQVGVNTRFATYSLDNNNINFNFR